MNIGDYVKTKEGEIIKITIYNEQKDNPLWEVINGTATMKGSIIKSSPNIIDLIEVGDYVNGFKIEILSKDKKYGADGDFNIIYNIDEGMIIKSIVTKEQYERMEYKI